MRTRSRIKTFQNNGWSFSFLDKIRLKIGFMAEPSALVMYEANLRPNCELLLERMASPTHLPLKLMI